MRIPIIGAIIEREREKARGEGLALGRKEAVEQVRNLLSNQPLGTPQLTWGKSPHAAYQWDNPYQYTVPQSPRRRPGSLVDVTTLRYLAETYDVLRACIEHLKREVASVPLEIVPKDGAKVSDRRLKQAREWFSADGGLGGRGKYRTAFEKEMIEDVLVVGACAVYTPGPLVSEALILDAATIRPVVDGFGWDVEDRPYEQWIQGMAAASFTRDELRYDGLYPRSWTPYFASPIEWILKTIIAAGKADDWNLAWLTDGNTAAQMLAMPESWTPGQIQEFWQYWDQVLSGNSNERQKTKFVPGGTSKVGDHSRKDQDFGEYELWLLRRTCSIMGVQPSSIGFAGEQYKVSQEGSNKQTSAFGAGQLLEFRKSLYDWLLVRLGYPDLEATNVVSTEEGAGERTDRLTKAAGGPYLTVNEARAEEGREPIEGGETLRTAGPAPTDSEMTAPAGDEDNQEDESETD